MNDRTVGVVGVGQMGRPMVANLVEEAFDVVAYDPNEEAMAAAAHAGASAMDSPAEVGSNADVVLVVVPTDDHVRQACLGSDGLFEDMDEGCVVVHSSTYPSLPAEIQDDAPGQVSVVDAPMCRGVGAAERGDILFLVGGDDDAIERTRGVLETCGEVVVLGTLGAGQVGKTSNNLLLWISILGNYEVLRLADSLDIDVDPLKLREVLPKSSGDNWAVRRGNWENLRLSWPEKDLAIALDLADEADSPIPVSGLASQLIKDVDVEDLEPFYFDGE